MSEQIDAIYDHGVFKPLVPLALPDQARVKLTIDAEPHDAGPESESLSADETAIVARQKAALEDLRRKIDELPQHRSNDGWSVRQHDELLYGDCK